MDSESQTKVDPRKQALLEARFFGTGREDIEVKWSEGVEFPFVQEKEPKMNTLNFIDLKHIPLILKG